jgi:hypothetical protein
MKIAAMKTEKDSSWQETRFPLCARAWNPASEEQLQVPHLMTAEMLMIFLASGLT